MKTLYDAALTKNIPTDATLVAGYDDGKLYTWSAADWARFPNATLIHITATGETLTSHVADIEPGDLTPADAADWLRRRLAAGITTDTNIPTLYCNQSSLPAVRAACHGFAWQLWLADPTGTAHLADGSMATQYSWAGKYDTSLVDDRWSPLGAVPPAQPTLADVLQALSYLKAETARVAEQYGAG